MSIVEQMLKNAPNPLLHIADVCGSALFNADCMDILPLIPDKSVQLILADLPYGTTNLKWDSVLDLNKLSLLPLYCRVHSHSHLNMWQ